MKFIIHFFKRFFFSLNFVLVLVSLFALQVIYSVDIRHWLTGFIGLAFPLIIVLNLFYVLAYAYLKSWKVLLSLVVLGFAYPLFSRTFKFSFSKNEASVTPSFSIASYNVYYLGLPNKKISAGISNSINNLNADFLCLQEFQNKPEPNDIVTIKKLQERFKFYTYMHSSSANKNANGTIGLITFSKYPILKKEEVYWGVNKNGMLITDVLVNEDTLKLINLQFRSMGIRVQKILEADKSINKDETKNILYKLKNGFSERIFQVDELEGIIRTSKYPVVVVGDFNEIPFGYAYGKVREYLSNSFETNGSGFGFTYRKAPKFLRIDNQFYDKNRIENTEFETLTEHKFSDHYPILGRYVLKKEYKETE